MNRVPLLSRQRGEREREICFVCFLVFFLFTLFDNISNKISSQLVIKVME